MNILVVGGGGREHAIIRAIRKNKTVDRIYVLPGNGGIAALAACVPIKTTDIDGIVTFAKAHDIGFAVIAPDDPLVLGAVDALEAEGIPCFGPDAKAAAIEGSKAFSKNLMKKYTIPTAQYEVAHSEVDAIALIEQNTKYPLVIKADGLALGKGVIIAENEKEALDAVRLMMREHAFGKSGDTIVIEEFLTGPEVSVLAFTDGDTLVPMVSSMDHKRANDHDVGLNTGGMGAVAPNPYYTPEMAARCMRDIFLPTIGAMKKEGRPFRGCLYFGLMLTEDGPKVIEYNCRFGDPEAQAVLPLLETDLLTVMQAVQAGNLDSVKVRFKSGAACCVVLASGGYPAAYETNKRISIDEDKLGAAHIYHAGTKLHEGALFTSGGRVIGITATASTLPDAVQKAYDAAAGVSFEQMHMRSDIGRHALLAAFNGQEV